MADLWTRLFTLKRKEALKQANITHVLSVLTLPLDDTLFNDYKQFPIDIDDDDDKDIIQHFPASNAFIQEGLDRGGGVLVHCAMGKSRSAAIVLAYMMSINPQLTPMNALNLLRRARSICEPNPGFMEQLNLYHRMRCSSDVLSHPQYQRWLWEREMQHSLELKKVPGSEFIVFGDETPAPEEVENDAQGDKVGEDEEKGNTTQEVSKYEM
ncbi:MAG: hypothetical protein Q9222_006168 [Ikaeria aurantiellina]